MDIYKSFRFEAAHHLPHVPDGHKCSRLHGHSYEVKIRVRGDVGERTGWVCDFSEIATAWAPIGQRLDHYYLNEIAGLENPTSENLARWIWSRLTAPDLVPVLGGLVSVTVCETCTSGCEYFGPGR